MQIAKIVFRSDLEAIVSHTDADGTVTVGLQSGRYPITITKLGLVKLKILDVQVPMSEGLRVAMKADHTPTDGPMIYIGTTATTFDRQM